MILIAIEPDDARIRTKVERFTSEAKATRRWAEIETDPPYTGKYTYLDESQRTQRDTIYLAADRDRNR